MTCKLRTVGVRLGQHTHTCSIHHFKEKMLNINIFAISSNIFTFSLDFEQNAAKVNFQKQIEIIDLYFCFLTTKSILYDS